MKHNLYMYIFVMAAVTYLIRMLPLTLIRKEIKNTFIKSFLYYVPYVTSSCYDLSGHSDSHRQYLVCRHWFCNRTDPCMEQKKSDLCFPVFMCRRISG